MFIDPSLAPTDCGGHIALPTPPLPLPALLRIEIILQKEDSLSLSLGYVNTCVFCGEGEKEGNGVVVGLEWRRFERSFFFFSTTVFIRFDPTNLSSG